MIANSSQQRRSPIAGVISSATDVAGDFIELAELQIELARSDVKQFTAQSIASVVAMLVASVTLLACMPVALFGLADALSKHFSFDVGLSRLAVGTAGAMLAMVVLIVCGLRLRKGLSSFRQSHEQLQNNVSWLKDVLRGRL